MPSSLTPESKSFDLNQNSPRKDEAQSEAVDPPQQPSTKHSWRFWLIFLSLCLTSFASALDSTIVTTALPTITKQIGGQERNVWIANCFVFSATTVQPLVGQLSNIFGRRVPMMASVALFTLGSGIAGGATNVPMLIAGRTVQGLGSGGIFVLVELITCDLVPLRERAQYLGMMLSTGAIGTTLGPIIGGGLAQANWRWVFYINLPIAGTAFLSMVFFLRVKHTPEASLMAALARVDYFGTFIFISSICAILLGLVLGGTSFPWSSWHIFVPLVLGFIGWAIYHVYESSSLCLNPSTPPNLFSNRTSFVGFFLTFISALLLEWTVYFLPIYFQAVRSTSPLTSGVNLLPLNLFLLPGAIIAGIVLTKSGRYRPLHWFGFGLSAIACGLFSILNPYSSRAAWVCFQILAALGLGSILTTILPSIQASLPESDVAAVTSMFSFFRSFGFVWGVTIPSIIFNTQFDHYSPRITDTQVRAQLVGGQAYGYAGSGLIPALDAVTKAQVLSVYTDTLKVLWRAAVAFAGVAFLAVFVARDVELRTELVSEFGLDEGKKPGEQSRHMDDGDEHQRGDVESQPNGEDEKVNL